MLRDTQRYNIDRLVVPLRNGQYATFSPSGKLLVASDEADSELIYLVEESSGRLRPLSRAEFHRRSGWN